jgi:transcriptional regulator with XRE-family HTH domain
MKTDLLTYVLGQLERDTVHVPTVSKATGISVQWLYQLRGGKIPNPGVKQIQKLADYFRKSA